MNQLPQDPFMLLSTVNMLLRDGAFDSLDDLAAAYGTTADDITRRLAEAGFEYLPEARRFA
ncbi:MAG: DUF4250 domain-containing protein [Bacteroides sp.]|nr:DUF4250 domain-containing protein [Bacteroides sp.]MCM1095200.1 DUF4250 domain-containing protein [Terasakiella sp.]